MRFLLMFLVALACVALFAVGAPSVLVGIAEQGHADDAYVVGFVPDADCGDDHELYLRVMDATVLDCAPAGVSGSGQISLPGFTAAQEEELETLAANLGMDGLSAEEQQEIQRRVDEVAASVPQASRPYGDQAVWGAGRAWLGAGMVVAAVLGLIATFRFGPAGVSSSR
ncbi:hypothetical protein SAMN05216266_11122 [Amycolatopsis marina]|uniref:Uncharacterized protein n=1 Tax=Amycolatopsis marina TaxID=490629 RepID=A0A1I1AXI2_9PSEU|nr:hypothetical protein [Amycolatopsis marina]SFB42799.1 hypothetical protein SAMN05216266_11122 [Amycolatopsis marina]